jgi:hypothetical protein
VKKPNQPTGTVVQNCTFTNQPSPEAVQAVMALAKAAEENAKAIRAATEVFTPKAMLMIGGGQ